jgi:hypothetical protein
VRPPPRRATTNLATNGPAAFHRNAYRKVQPLLLDEIDQADAANPDGIADVGNLGQLDTPARLLSDDDTSTGTSKRDHERIGTAAA